MVEVFSVITPNPLDQKFAQQLSEGHSPTAGVDYSTQVGIRNAATGYIVECVKGSFSTRPEAEAFAKKQSAAYAAKIAPKGGKK